VAGFQLSPWAAGLCTSFVCTHSCKHVSSAESVASLILMLDSRFPYYGHLICRGVLILPVGLAGGSTKKICPSKRVAALVDWREDLMKTNRDWCYAS
jgi:hypothetical protein